MDSGKELVGRRGVKGSKGKGKGRKGMGKARRKERNALIQKHFQIKKSFKIKHIALITVSVL